jgi:hypothetical protein
MPVLCLLSLGVHLDIIVSFIMLSLLIKNFNDVFDLGWPYSKMMLDHSISVQIDMGE